MEFFHPYKKLLEDVWRKPELFYTFFAPLCHSLNPKSPVKIKPKLKLIDSYFTMLRLLWPEFRAGFRGLLPDLTGKIKTHMQNILLIFEFFIPIVSVSIMLLVIKIVGPPGLALCLFVFQTGR